MEKRSVACRAVTVIVGVLLVATAAQAGPPLPTHQVEGNSGVFITPTAYFANPAEPNTVFGLPSVSGTYADIGQKDFESFVITENLWGRVELGYAIERIDLCDQINVNGKDLVKHEDDWWDLCLGYIVNDHITVAGGYANFGKILNHREDNV